MNLSPPLYLRLNSGPFDRTPVSIREYFPQPKSPSPDGPLLLITFHPGYLTGSYQQRDYFERIAPLLVRQAPGCFHLRLFTINHPGYDLPTSHVVDRFQLEPYRVKHQPRAMARALEWLFQKKLAQEKDIHWIAYGHSMGGLALSRFRPATVQRRLADQGRRLHFIKILSAPAFYLHPHLQTIIGQLDGLHLLKHTVGRLPFYEPVATGLYLAFAPYFFRRDAARYSIEAFSDFGDYRRMNPFVMLEQGRELLRFPVMEAGGPDLLADTHVILGRQDGMLDLPATRDFINTGRERGLSITLHALDSTHLLELDTPAPATEVILDVINKEMTSPRGDRITAKATYQAFI